MTYQDRQRVFVERRAREREEARSRRRPNPVYLAVAIAVLWGIERYPLAQAGAGHLRVAGAIGLIGAVGCIAYLRRTPEFRSWRSKRSVMSRLKTSLALAGASLLGGFVGFIIGIGAFHLANGMFDEGPVTTTAYDVVSLPAQHCSRSGCSVGLRSRDGRKRLVHLRVGRFRPLTDWQGVVVELDTKPGRFGEAWITEYRRVRLETAPPEPPVLSGGHCHPAYERVFGPCPPP